MNRSSTPQLVVSWSGRSFVKALIPNRKRNLASYRNLIVRAVTTRSGRNPYAGGQKMNIVLVDRKGNSASVAAERRSTALRTPFGDRVSQLILSDIRVPLGKFSNVDLSNLRSVELHFGIRGRNRGQVQIADVGFEGRSHADSARAARASDTPGEIETPGPVPGPDTAIDALPLVGTGLVGAGAANCAANQASPSVSVTGSLVVPQSSLELRGNTDASGCDPIERVQIAVMRRVDGQCAYLDARGRFMDTPDCRHPYSFIATGTGDWSIRLPAANGLEGATVVATAITSLGRTGGKVVPLPGIPD